MENMKNMSGTGDWVVIIHEAILIYFVILHTTLHLEHLIHHTAIHFTKLHTNLLHFTTLHYTIKCKQSTLQIN